MSFRGVVGLLVALLPFAGLAQSKPYGKECEVSALGVCAQHILRDEVSILTSPLHARPSDLLWIAPLGIATGVAIDYDAHALRTLGIDSNTQDTFRQVSDVGGVYVPIAAIVGGYALGARRKDDYLKQTAVISAEAIVDALILNEGLKYAINREDPSQGDRTGRFWPHGTKTWPDGQSMPSGHSLTAWTLAHVIADRYPSWHTKLLVYSLATTVSATRVVARQHFPSDVLVGSAVGYMIGGYVAHKRGEPSRSFALSMVDTPNGPGMQLSYNFNHQ
jgi:membrane-associated phospholipid phosphatase